MSSIIQNLLNNTLGNAARSAKFDCIINFSNTSLFNAENEIFAHVKTSQFPGKTHDTIDLKFKGRSIPIKGQTKYDNTWSCTFYLTEDHSLKKAFEDWIESLDQRHNIKPVSGPVQIAQENNNFLGYSGTLKIAQLDFWGSSQTVLYELYNCFPKSVSSVDLDYSSVGEILEFTVEFSYTHFNTVVISKSNGSYINDIVQKPSDTIPVPKSMDKEYKEMLKEKGVIFDANSNPFGDVFAMAPATNAGTSITNKNVFGDEYSYLA
jgi:hypothetical protein